MGTILASPRLTKPMRQVHDFLTIGAAAPLLQRAGATAYAFPPAYYDKLAADYQTRRDRFCGYLARAGFGHVRPEGAYYVMADISSLGYANDREAAWPSCATPAWPACQVRASGSTGRGARITSASASARRTKPSTKPAAGSKPSHAIAPPRFEPKPGLREERRSSRDASNW